MQLVKNKPETPTDFVQDTQNEVKNTGTQEEVSEQLLAGDMVADSIVISSKKTKEEDTNSEDKQVSEKDEEKVVNISNQQFQDSFKELRVSMFGKN